MVLNFNKRDLQLHKANDNGLKTILNKKDINVVQTGQKGGCVVFPRVHCPSEGCVCMVEAEP
jgi:hypothetical protein